MASGMEPFYLLQTAFTGGEISPEVANRVDLDKYQFALLTAQNCLVRPYGPVYKRTGLKYCLRAKYADKKCILKEFAFTDTINYLLEIGVGYIRVHKNGVYLNVEMTTPFTEEDLPNLRFTQSADIMYIASGKYPVKQIARYSESDWRLTDFEVDEMYFDVSQVPPTMPGAVYNTPGTYVFTASKTGEYRITVAGAGAGGTGEEYIYYSKEWGCGGQGSGGEGSGGEA